MAAVPRGLTAGPWPQTPPTDMTSLAYPHMRLDIDALNHNVQVMADWCTAHGVLLAPHAKTTMSHPIIGRQAAAGAVAMTVATAQQADTLLAWGHHRIIIANEVVDAGALSLLRTRLKEDDGRSISIFIDSDEGLSAAQRVFAPPGPELQVLVEVGTPGGRAGVRDAAAARRLAEKAARATGVRLAGVAGYEGVVPNSRDAGTVAAVDLHCGRVRDVFGDVAGLFEVEAPIFSLGGSAFPDRVVRHLPALAEVPGARFILRAGCYVTHDHGIYASVGPIAGLVPAVTVRAVVLSVPEPGTAVVGAGKRELPYDAGLPMLLGAQSADRVPRHHAQGTVHRLFDHHAVLTGAAELMVGDIIDLGISHPCSLFDRWDDYLVIDSSGTDVDIWSTSFRRRTSNP